MTGARDEALSLPERGLEPRLLSAASGPTACRRLIPETDRERARGALLGPWVNGPRAWQFLQERSASQEAVWRRRDANQPHTTGVVSPWPSMVPPCPGSADGQKHLPERSDTAQQPNNAGMKGAGDGRRTRSETAGP
ncbi:MAG: hypothetical protein MZV70_40685 [Desulfobacterales bacterium]|nr:hypothetical protein [Desulfobacterales bacterium]